MQLNRRKFLSISATALILKEQLQSESHRFRLGICNETFENWSFRDAMKGTIRFGYTGTEISPFTLAEDPSTLTASQRNNLRNIMVDENVDYIGLHNILKAPKGLHVTTSNSKKRHEGWEFFRKLIDLAADLGDDARIIFGSSKQRSAKLGETTVADAKKRLTEGLAHVAPEAEARGVKILMEPLAPHLCDVVNTMAEAVEIVDQVNNPAVRAMFDTHNAVAETLDHGEVIKKYLPYIEHVHINEMDGRHPGTGSYDFLPVLRALKSVKFRHWLSLEVFKFKPSPEVIARESERLLRKWESELT